MESKRTATTYFIPPGKFLLLENALGNPDLIQSSVSSDCRVTIVDRDNFPLDELEQWPTFRLVSADIKLKLGNGQYHIYIAVPSPDNTETSTAFVSYSTKAVDLDGYEIIPSVGEDGNPTTQKGALLGKSGFKYYPFGTVSARGGNPSAVTVPAGQGRRIEVDLGVTPAPSTLPGGLSDFDRIFQVDKIDPSNPKTWLLTILILVKEMTARLVRITDRLIFGEGEREKAVTGIKRSIDSDQEFLVDEYGEIVRDVEGNPIPNPDYVPISDETIPTTKYIKSLSDDRYLKKYEPDETEHLIKFFDGIEVGEYVEGSLAVFGGRGTRFSADGYGEMNGLRLREFLEVPELRFNRIDVVNGILWNSIAFGLIESVDVESRTCTLKLEDGERSGLRVMDICVGMFSDFGDGFVPEVYDPLTGEVIDPGHDANGLPRMYGFSTSYFTPEAILQSGPGVFRFRYRLQEGTSAHPKPSMKFAVYGNFIDASRQSSAYSTRTYKRYLHKVDSWVIDPDKNICAQYGDLTGLTIGGFSMSGYGSFQSNAYLTGVQIQFTPQQKEELKGADAYSVSLSDYEGVVVVDEEGNIIGGERQMYNVVSDGENLISGDANVVTSGYRLQTTVQARRGSVALYYAPEVPSAGSYVMGVAPVGCTAMVVNGTVIVTSVTDKDNCRVSITVNCEGKSSFVQEYRITAVSDGSSPIIADLDNEMDSVACDPDGKVLFGLPVSTTIGMWAGTKALKLDSAEVSAPEGVTARLSYIGQDGRPLSDLSPEQLESVTSTRCVVTIPEGGITPDAGRVLKISVTVYATFGGVQYHKRLVFTVNKVIPGENAVIYKLSPSVSSVKVDKANQQSTYSVSCGVVAFDGRKASALESMPEGLTMQHALDKGTPSDYALGSEVSVSASNEWVSFYLYQDGVLIDTESVPVVKDGNAVEEVVEYYLATSYGYEDGVTREDGVWGTWQQGTIPQLSEDRKFLWNYEMVRYSGSEPSYTEPTIIAWWTKDGRGIKEIIEWYMLTDDRLITPGYDDPRWQANVAPDMDNVNRYLWNYEEIIWTEGEPTRTRPAIIGAFGDEGLGALSLTCSYATVHLNSLGAFDPSSVLVRSLRGGDPEEVYLTVYGRKENGTPVALTPDNFHDVKGMEWSIDLDRVRGAEYKQLIFRAYIAQRFTDWSVVPDAECSVTFVYDGADGPMPRNMGQFDMDTYYYFNAEYRDFVWVDGGGNPQVYIRINRGATVGDTNGAVKGVSPLSSNGGLYWQQADRQSLMAIDTALIDGAWIGGFMIQDGRMVSQNDGSPNLVLDGGTGYFKCVDANIDGKLTARKMSYRTAVDIDGSSVALDGYTMAVGAGSFVLPNLTAGENIQIRAFNPSTLNGVNKPMKIISSGTFQPMRMYQKDLYGDGEDGFVNLWKVTVNYDEMYTFTGVGGSFKIGGTFVSGYWMVSSSAGSASGAATKVITDGALDESSKNPVANWVIKTEFDKVRTELADKIQIANTYNEAVQGEPGVLYLIR